jgi:hypothetical protein
VHVAFAGVAQQAAEGLAAASGVGGDGLGVAGEDGAAERDRAVEAGHERGRTREQDLGYDAGS